MRRGTLVVLRSPRAIKLVQPRIRRSVVQGVGWHMERITESLGLTPRDGCHCKGLAAEMNRLGPAVCKKHREKLVGKLKTNATKYKWGDVAKAAAKALLTGLAWRLDLTDVYGSLLDEAIRRTEAEGIDNANST